MRVTGYLLRRHPRELAAVLTRVPLGSVLETLANYEDGDAMNGESFELRVRGVQHPQRLRRGTSDFQVFRQVLINRQYALDLPGPVDYIVDAGANVGYSSVYLLNRFPNARLIAIEPDPDNFHVAQSNLSPYGNRCHLVLGALWSHAGRLRLSRGTFRDGRQWSTQTLPGEGRDDAGVEAHTLSGLMAEFKFPRIDFLKVDIEGAELAVFRDGDVSCLGETRCCAVECHGEESEQAVRATLGRLGFGFRRAGELTIAVRPSP